MGTASTNANDLSKMRAFLNMTEELLAKTFHGIEMSEVTVHCYVPAVNVDRVQGGVAVATVSLMSTMARSSNTGHGVTDFSTSWNVVIIKTPSVVTFLGRNHS